MPAPDGMQERRTARVKKAPRGRLWGKAGERSTLAPAMAGAQLRTECALYAPQPPLAGYVSNPLGAVPFGAGFGFGLVGLAGRADGANWALPHW